MTRLRISSQIVQEVARAFNVPLDMMLSKGRDPSLVRARWAAMKMIKDERRLSLGEIARLVHRDDHSTVHYGIRQAEKLIANDPGFASSYERAQGR